MAPKLPEFALAGALPPIGAPHHLRDDEWLPYREGVVLKSEEGVGSYVDVGLDRMVYIEEHLPLKARVTVALGPEASTRFMEAYSESMLVGKVRSLQAPACSEDRCNCPDRCCCRRRGSTSPAVGQRAMHASIHPSMEPHDHAPVRPCPCQGYMPAPTLPCHAVQITEPAAARTALGLCWGYSVRVVAGLQNVLIECPFHKGGYDLTIGGFMRSVHI